MFNENSSDKAIELHGEIFFGEHERSRGPGCVLVLDGVGVACSSARRSSTADVEREGSEKILVVFFSRIPRKTNSHGPQGMEHCGSAEWVVPDHPRSQAALSSVGSVPQSLHRDSEKAKSPEASSPQFPRRTPDSGRIAPAAKIARIQDSIAVLGDEDPEEVGLLTKTLANAEQQV